MAGEGTHRAEPGRGLAAPTAPRGAAPATLREHLPGLEPDRQITDWGRSEIVDGALDRFVYEFLFHYWFRVDVEGIAGVPADGPALLVANRAGVLPADAAMIAKAIRERGPGQRAVHFATDRRLGATPGLDMLIVKAGGVSAHPANLQRLLYDEGQLVLAFPESGPAAVLRSRYRLRPFAHLEPLRVALAAGAPIVPVAVLGGEEATPVLARLRRLPLGMALPLPAKLRLRFLDPVIPNADDDAERLAGSLRSLIQEHLLEMVSQRRSVWLG
jgi:1-acyl-sn-glycerol-3-phosphate acyltransferase